MITGAAFVRVVLYVHRTHKRARRRGLGGVGRAPTAGNTSTVAAAIQELSRALEATAFVTFSLEIRLLFVKSLNHSGFFVGPD